MGNKNLKAPDDQRLQMALELPVNNLDSREDVVLGSANSLAIDLIDAWPKWPGLVVVLAGPVGSGKSHIANAWARRADAKSISINSLKELGNDRVNGRNLLLEDAGPGLINETELFHVINTKRALKSSIIITSRSWPGDWDIKLADLSSRLRAAQLVELGEPDDELLRKVLFKLFSDRQLPVDPGVIDYLVVRMERSLDAAYRIVAQLDARGLAQKRKITRILAGEVLAEDWPKH